MSGPDTEQPLVDLLFFPSPPVVFWTEMRQIVTVCKVVVAESLFLILCRSPYYAENLFIALRFADF